MDANGQVVFIIVYIITLIWIFLWKGIALWHSARHGQKNWFIAIVLTIFPPVLFFSTGLIDIIYLFFFAKDKLTLKSIIEDVKHFFRKKPRSKSK